MPADYLDDDYDPLAPPPVEESPEDDAHDGDVPAAAPAVAEARDDEEAGEPEDDGEIVGADGSVGDGRGIVRLWLADGQLTRVRISPVWHTKVTPEKLTDCFAAALAMSAMVADPADHDAADDTPDVDLSGLPPLTPAVQAAFDAELADLEQRWEQAAAASAEGDDIEPEVFWGRSEGALVRVDGSGTTVAVEFDPQWLRATHAGVVAKHVVVASDRAHQRAAESTPEPGPLQQLAIEFRVMKVVYEAMLRKAGHDVR